MTPTHLVVMDFFVKHEKEVAYLESYQELIEVFSRVSKQTVDASFFKLVCDDLKARSLVRLSDELRDLPGIYSVTLIAAENQSQDPRIIVTDLGRSFVAFVLSPSAAPLGVFPR